MSWVGFAAPLAHSLVDSPLHILRLCSRMQAKHGAGRLACIADCRVPRHGRVASLCRIIRPCSKHKTSARDSQAPGSVPRVCTTRVVDQISRQIRHSHTWASGTAQRCARRLPANTATARSNTISCAAVRTQIIGVLQPLQRLAVWVAEWRILCRQGRSGAQAGSALRHGQRTRCVATGGMAGRTAAHMRGPKCSQGASTDQQQPRSSCNTDTQHKEQSPAAARGTAARGAAAGRCHPRGCQREPPRRHRRRRRRCLRQRAASAAPGAAAACMPGRAATAPRLQGRGGGRRNGGLRTGRAQPKHRGPGRVEQGAAVLWQVSLPTGMCLPLAVLPTNPHSV